MESDEKPEKGKGKDKGKARGSRKRKEPQPPLQPDRPVDEGAPAAAHPETPPAAGGAGREKISSRREQEQAGDPRTMRVAEIMTEDPVCCLPETPLSKVARMMAENSCGVIPVIRGQADRTPAGIITDRDIAVKTVALGRNPLELKAEEVMTPSPAIVRPDDTVQHCADVMRTRQIRSVLVADGQGQVRGLVIRDRIAKYLPSDFSGETVRDTSQPPQ